LKLLLMPIVRAIRKLRQSTMKAIPLSLLLITNASFSMAQDNDQATCEVMSDAEMRQKLSPMQYAVTRQDATERPFQNEYWDNKREGIYVDIISGEPLFSSKAKYDSGTGWPSFTEPLVPENFIQKTDKKLGYTRVEVRSKKADSHLGHVFDDGPGPNGKRYCMNSASLRFVAVEDLEKEGYGEYLKLFEKR